MWSANLFFSAFGGINIILLLSYYILKVNVKDFASVHKNYHMYMLISASIAYILNLIHVTYIYRSGRMSSSLQLAALSFYTLQLLFIPFVRSRNGMFTRLLLLLCCFPIAYIHTYSKGYERFISMFVFLHVFINDFVLYGFMHDNTI